MSRKSNRDKLTVIAIIAIMLLLLINAYMMYNKYNQDKIIQQQQQELEEVTNLKNDLDEEYYEALSELDDLKSDNEELNQIIEEQKEKVREQKKTIDRLIVDRRKFREAQAQLEEMKSNIDQYLGEMEQLYKEKEALTNQNMTLEERNKSLEMRVSDEEKKKQRLKEEKDTLLSSTIQLKKQQKRLAEKVDLASVIRAEKIEAEGYKVSRSGKYRSRRKANNIDVLKICFQTTFNRVAPKGEETFFIRIINPVGETMAINALGSGTFGTDAGQEIRYTQSIEIDYQGEPNRYCMEWKPNASFQEGLYEIEIYNKGHRTGKETFEMN
jgi:predicted  nucleic acid-binding Zn-ribbon protein